MRIKEMNLLSRLQFTKQAKGSLSRGSNSGDVVIVIFITCGLNIMISCILFPCSSYGIIKGWYFLIVILNFDFQLVYVGFYSSLVVIFCLDAHCLPTSYNLVIYLLIQFLNQKMIMIIIFNDFKYNIKVRKSKEKSLYLPKAPKPKPTNKEKCKRISCVMCTCNIIECTRVERKAVQDFHLLHVHIENLPSTKAAV